MSKPTRERGWFKSSLRNVLVNARTSVIVTVALLPSLLAQVFLYFSAVSPLQWIIGLALSMIAVFLLFLYLEWRAQPKDVSGFIRDALDAEQRGRIRRLVTVVSNMQTERTKAAQELIRGLPNLNVVYCVTPDGDDPQHQLQLLRDWARKQGRGQIDIRALNTAPDRLTFDEAKAQSLGEELRFAQGGEDLIVDVTADTKLMTLTLYLAAVHQGLPVTYIPSAREGHPGEAFALSVIRDPAAFFATNSLAPTDSSQSSV